MAVGRAIQSGGPRVEDPCSETSDRSYQTSYKAVIFNDTGIGHLIKILRRPNDDVVVFNYLISTQRNACIF